MVVYFSGTGNSRYAARAFAEGLDLPLVDAADFIRSGRRADLSSDGPWVFVSPTYAWRIPRVFEDFLRRSAFSGGREAWFVMTCGSEIGNAARYLKSLCAETGMTYRGVLQLTMPENYIAMFKAPGEEESRRILAETRPAIRAGIEAVRHGRDFPAWKPSLSDKAKSGFVNEGFCRFFLKADKFFVTGACIGCGKCEALCPLDNVQLTEGRPVWGDRCTHCMACICHCPAEAIEYGKASRGQRRYRCPEWGSE